MKKIRKVALILAIVMAFQLCPVILWEHEPPLGGNAAAAAAWTDESYWDDSFTLATADDFYALAAVVNRSHPAASAEELAAYQVFLPDLTVVSAADYDTIAKGKFSLMGDDIALDAPGFSGIGTALTPFMGEINGHGRTVTASVAVSTGDTIAAAGLFGAVEGALFYNLCVSSAVTLVSTASGADICAGGLIGLVLDNGDITVADTVTVTGSLDASATNAANTYAGGLAGYAANGPSSLSVLASSASLNTAYTGTHANLTESQYLSNMPAIQADKLVVHQLMGNTIYAFGPGVEGGNDGVYTVQPGTQVTIVAVNESREFGAWRMVGATPAGATYSTTFTMPGAGVVVSCTSKAQTPALGRSFATAYELATDADIFALQKALSDTAANPVQAANLPAYKELDPSITTNAQVTTAQRTKFRQGYYKVTSDIRIANTSAQKFLGIGVSGSTTNFNGFIDGFYINESGEKANRKLTFTQYLNNPTLYGGLIAYSVGSSTGYTMLRNLDTDGEFTYKHTSTSDSFYGGLIASATYTMVLNCNAGVRIESEGAKGAVYVGGLIGKATYCYLKDSSNSGQTLLEAEVDPTVAKWAYLGGIAGDANECVVDHVNVRIGQQLYVGGQPRYYDGIFRASALTGAVVGGLFGRFGSSSGAPIKSVVRGCEVIRIDENDTTKKTISATATSTGKAWAGGLFGLVYAAVAANNPGVLLDDNRISLGDCELNIFAGDSNTTGTDKCSLYAGGYSGAFSTSNTASGLGLGSNIAWAGDSSLMLSGKINVTVRNYGMGSTTLANSSTINCAGGISGINIPNISGESASKPNVIDLSNMNIRVEQKYSNTNTSAIKGCVGGLVGQAQNSAVFKNITVIGDKTNIVFLREQGNRATDAASSSIPGISVGGVAGEYLGVDSASNLVENVNLMFTDSTVWLHQMSYDAGAYTANAYKPNDSDGGGNVAIGGMFGYLYSGLSNCSFSALNSTTIYGITSSKGPISGGHGKADIYCGGLVGFLAGKAGANSRKISNCTFTGSWTEDGDYRDVRTVEARCNQSANSPAVGGLAGFISNAQIENSEVKSAYVYGDSLNDNMALTDTDIIVGGLFGLSTGKYGSADSLDYFTASKCTVSDSRIEANGRYYTLTYAGGIMGAAYSSTKYQIDQCVSYRNRIIATSQKKWAASGGVMGYRYETNATIANSAAIDCTIEAYASGEETLTTNPKFAAVSAGGGIIGKVSRSTSTGNNTTLQNCYSNSKFIVVNPYADKIYRGGLIGHSLSGTCATVITNSFYHLQNAGTALAVDLATNSTFEDGIQNTTAITGEIVNGTPLDFDLVNLYRADPVTPATESANIFGVLKPAGVAIGAGYPSATSVTAARVPTELSIAENAATPFGYKAGMAGTTNINKLTYADMTISVNGVDYAFGQKPFFIGELSAASAINLYRGNIDVEDGEDHSLELVPPAGEEIDIVSGESVRFYTGEGIYAGITDKTLVKWEFSLNSAFTLPVSAGELSSYITVDPSGNICSFNANVPIDDIKVFYFRATSVNAPKVVSPTVKITVKPIFITGVRATNINAGNSITNPYVISYKDIKTLIAEIAPQSVALKSHTFAAYQLSGGVPTTTKLNGVKSDGMISGPELYAAVATTGKVVADEVFAVFITTVGKAEFSDGTGLMPGWGCSVNTARQVVSAPIYVKLKVNIPYKIICIGGDVTSAPAQITPGMLMSITTTPRSGMAPMPGVAYYRSNTENNVQFDIVAEGSGTPDLAQYSVDGDVSSFVLTVPSNSVEMVVVINYFSLVRITYKDLLDNIIAITAVSKYLQESDILQSDGVFRKGEVFAGWYTSLVLNGDAVLDAGDPEYPAVKNKLYLDKLAPSSIAVDGDGVPIIYMAVAPFKRVYTEQGESYYLDDDGNRVAYDGAVEAEYINLLPANEYTVYPRLQYSVEMINSASLLASSCGNMAFKEVNNKLAPVNTFSDYVLKLNKPAGYVGEPRFDIIVGNVRLTPDKYTVSGDKVTIPAANLVLTDAQHAALTGSWIKIYTYHNNLVFFPLEGTSFGGSNAVLPKDGRFTFLYTVNHAKTASGATYGFANAADLNNLCMKFEPQLPVGSVIEVHRRSGASAANNQELFWYRVRPDSDAMLELNRFTEIGLDSAYKVDSFGAYLPATVTAAFVEQFYVVVTPPAYTGGAAQQLSNTKVTVGFNGVNSAPNTDNRSVAAAGSFVTEPLQDVSLVFNGTPSLTSGQLTFALPAAPANNDRHTGNLYGLSFGLVNAATLEPVAFPDGCKLTFNGVTLSSTTKEPLWRGNFFAASGSFALINAPAGVKLKIELVEVPSDYYAEDFNTEQNVLKLGGGEIRRTLSAG